MARALLSRLGIFGALALAPGCRAVEVQVVACAADTDCDDGERCNADHECEDDGSAGSAGRPSFVPPEPLLLDDFEDGDPLPRDSRFAVWQHYSFNPPGMNVQSTPSRAAAHDSNMGMLLMWNVADRDNGGADYPGGGLRTLVANVYVDLSHHDRITFWHEFLPSATALCENPSSFTVVLGCGEFGTSFEAKVPIATSWTSAVVHFSDLTETTYQPQGRTLAECLPVVSDFHVHVIADDTLPDGGCLAGTLHFDDFAVR